MAEKSGLPTMAAIKGVSRSLVNAVTTPPNAAPITTPTAMSTTLPRRINFLNPSSIDTSKTDWSQMYDRKADRSSAAGHLCYRGKYNLERTPCRSAPAEQYTGNYNHRPWRDATVPP